MSTHRRKNDASLLLGKTRSSILGLLLTDPSESMYTREIIRAVGGSSGAVQRELGNLEGLGLLVRENQGNQVHYRANTEHPIYVDLRGLLLKTTGVADLIGAALEPLKSRIRTAFLHGSFAKGEEMASSDIDLMVIGEVTFREVSDRLNEAEREVGRELNASVYSTADFLERIGQGNHFLTTVLEGDKIMLIGDDDELRRLAEKPLAD